MSHEFMQEMIEKEKRTYRSFPTILSKMISNDYISKRKLTQRTDKLFKSISYSTKKPSEFPETELLSIKSKTCKGRAQSKNDKTSLRMQKTNFSNHKNQHVLNQSKQMESKTLNPFQTSYDDQYNKPQKIRWIPKRFASNSNANDRTFSQNFYYKEKTQTEAAKPEKNIINNSQTVPDDANSDCNKIIPNEGAINIEKINETETENTKIIGENVENIENCVCDDVKPQIEGNSEGESKIIKPQMSKTEYFKILNIGFQHLKNYRMPLEKLNDVVRENEEYFKHLAGICKCYKCTCGLHKCDLRMLKFNYSLPTQTSYQENFSQKSISLYASPTLKNDSMFSESKFQRDFVKESVTKSDFTNPHAKYTKPVFDHKLIDESPMIYKQSRYQSEFLNYASNPFPPTKILQQKTVINDLPFFGSTTYNQYFIDFAGQNSKIDISLPSIPNPLFKISLISFLTNINESKNNTGFMGVKTTNQREFRAYPVNQEKSIFKGNDDRTGEKLTFPGQYNTVTSRDFACLKKNDCPFSKINE